MLLNLQRASSATEPISNPDRRRNRTIIKLRRSIERYIRKIPRYVLVAAMTMLPVPCHGQSLCPWLNTATASDVLGGPATMTIDKTDDHTEACSFRSQTAQATDLLRISVTTFAEPTNAHQDWVSHENRCAPPSIRLKAVGNEAVLCAAGKAGARGKQVFGRVRNRVFTVEILTHSGKSKATVDPLEQKMERVAAQVAGALF